MSNVYHMEPPTKGKVVLKTTHGELEVELWPKEAPLACRNFVQLCLEGYYDNCILHRVIRGFMVQTGDPTGTGEGGDSIFGAPFKDEFHSRLRFTHRGLVACANANVRDTNNSQFFITLDQCPWLDRKHTIFGKVEGDTVFNLARIGDVDTDADDRPEGEPPAVLSAEVVWNPFDDIVPRTTPAAQGRAKQAAREAEEAAAREERNRGRVRDAALLSFGDDEDAQPALAPERLTTGKIRAAHELLRDDARLAKGGPQDDLTRRSEGAGAAEAGASAAGGEEDDGGAGDKAGASGLSFEAKMRAKMEERRKALGKVPERPAKGVDADREDSKGAASGGRGEEGTSGDEGGGRASENGASGSGVGADGLYDRREAERRYEALRGSRRVFKGTVPDRELLTEGQGRRKEIRERKRAMGDREKDTLERLQSFMKARGGKGDKGTGAGADKGGSGAAREAAAGGGKGTVSAGGGKRGRDGDAGGDDERTGTGASGDKNGSGGYDGRVDKTVDHRLLMPAPWRVDDYLDGSDDDDLEAVRSHRLKFSRGPGQGTMDRRDDADDYVVVDPLLEKGKGKWSKKAQDEKKRKTEWAGRARD